eukprot:m51a1_g324 hypothetical protein (871) ;mRNA; f:447384-451904
MALAAAAVRRRAWQGALVLCRHAALALALLVVAALLADAAPERHVTGRGRANFQRFLAEVVAAVRPSFVLVTGDIADSRKNELAAQQQEDQWRAYRDALVGHFGALPNASYWVEILGNHDMYKEVGSGQKRYPLLYTVGKQALYEPLRHYDVVTPSPLGVGNVTYKFLLANTAPRVPWQNIMGEMHRGDSRALGDAVRASTADLTVVVAHHTIGATGQDLVRDATSNMGGIPRSYAYHLAGHLHLVSHSRHRNGPLELVASALKLGQYRLLALDSGRMTIRDTELGEWPLVLVTNPKSAKFLSADEPALSRSPNSTLRILIWNDSPIVGVVVKISGEVVASGVYAEGEHTSPVYVFPWDASSVPGGSHRIEVVVADSAGHNRSSTDWFSLDGTVVSTETATSYAIRMRILVKGWSIWFMLYALVFVFFVAGSLAFGLLVRRWGGAESPTLDKVGAAFGPVAVAWIVSYESGRSTLDEYFEAEKLNWAQKLLAISTWQFQYSMWQMSFIPAWRRAVYCAIAVLHVAVPICFSPYPTGWAATWPWGTVVDHAYHQSEWGMAFSILFCGGVFYPALSIDASRSHNRERRPGAYHWMLLVLAMLCAAVVVFGIGAVFEGYSLLLSPMLWSCVALLALCWHLTLRPFYALCRRTAQVAQQAHPQPGSATQVCRHAALVLALLVVTGLLAVAAPERHVSGGRSDAGADGGTPLWFLQVSDIHISRLRATSLKAPERTRLTVSAAVAVRSWDVAQNFQRFLAEAVGTLRPSFVLVTGDIADSRINALSPEQHEDQWRAYRDALVAHFGALPNASYWVEVLGNHDMYNEVGKGQKRYPLLYTVGKQSLYESLRHYDVVAPSPSGTRNVTYKFLLADTV